MPTSFQLHPFFLDELLVRTASDRLKSYMTMLPTAAAEFSDAEDMLNAADAGSDRTKLGRDRDHKANRAVALIRSLLMELMTFHHQHNSHGVDEVKTDSEEGRFDYLQFAMHELINALPAGDANKKLKDTAIEFYSSKVKETEQIQEFVKRTNSEVNGKEQVLLPHIKISALQMPSFIQTAAGVAFPRLLVGLIKLESVLICQGQQADELKTKILAASISCAVVCLQLGAKQAQKTYLPSCTNICEAE